MRIERLEGRCERIESRVNYVDDKTLSLNGSFDRNFKDTSNILAAQKAQQRAIDDLVVRVAKLEAIPRTH